MAKTIMIQGTMSNAGKSLLAAGLCRIFHQDGYRVAPFKSQNMALNSFITSEGLEMGRAQVMQAEAAGIEPSVLMNPILLKPTNDIGSQVIVNGEVLGTMSARDYFKYKKKLVPDIMKAFHKLAEENDIIVIEGAGSPAEINLKSEDIVNMGMAKMAKAPVLLAGDIDRGGVFAQLYGTVELLEEDERKMIKGLIINKFRGDKSILDPGVAMLEEKCKIPVVGVAPYMNIQLEDEDSLTERFDRHQEVGVIDMAVIRVPRISNFTDFNPFESIPGVSLRYVQHPSDLKQPDVIFLPGTKNTMDDLKWLRESGMEALILKAAASGTLIFGICGGYQMLGENLSDPHGVEAGGTMRGIGLLPVDTVFAEHKTRTQVCGKFLELDEEFAPLKNVEFTGYEIHMGESTWKNGAVASTSTCDTVTGTEKTEGTFYHNVCGTYVHGIFDKEEVALGLVRAVGIRKGIDVSEMEGVDFAAFKETQYDILASELRKHLDMKKIYEILEQGVEDILEEIVGNILDEYDEDEQFIVRGTDGILTMSGMTPLEDAQEELGVKFPEEDLDNYDTINGLLISRLDRIPGEEEKPEVQYQGYLFSVLKVENKMIASVRVTRLPEEDRKTEISGEGTGEEEREETTE